MKIVKLEEAQIQGQYIVVRGDVDLGEEIKEGDEIKLHTIIPTLELLLQQGRKIVVIGHRGRPEGKIVESLSLRPVGEMLSKLLKQEVGFVTLEEFKDKNEFQKTVTLVENLRFFKEEEENSEEFARRLSNLGDFYINEAFSASHRDHASIVGVPKHLPYAAGLRFVSEVEHLSRTFQEPKRPVVMVISGLKKDKLEFLDDFKTFADRILLGGRLPEYIEEDKVSVRLAGSDEKVVVADLIQDKEDITIHSMEYFEKIISGAGTVVLSGPLGKYEEEGHRQGTLRVFNAVANSIGFKVAGGGDTEQAIELLGLKEKFDWISVGGGAMLEFLAKRSLPGIVALSE